MFRWIKTVMKDLIITNVCPYCLSRRFDTIFLYTTTINSILDFKYEVRISTSSSQHQVSDKKKRFEENSVFLAFILNDH